MWSQMPSQDLGKLTHKHQLAIGRQLKEYGHICANPSLFLGKVSKHMEQCHEKQNTSHQEPLCHFSFPFVSVVDEIEEL